MYPGARNARQEHIDHQSHVVGLAVLLLGLFMEMAVELVRIPDHILNTQNQEQPVFGTGIAFMAAAAWLLARMAVSLALPAKTPAPLPEP